jgi:hypothetical protein
MAHDNAALHTRKGPCWIAVSVFDHYFQSFVECVLCGGIPMVEIGTISKSQYPQTMAIPGEERIHKTFKPAALLWATTPGLRAVRRAWLSRK